MDQELHNLIGEWLKYTRTNKIEKPQDRDLRKFLMSKGFNPKVVDNLISSTVSAQKPAEVSPTATDNATANAEVNPAEKEEVLNKIKEVIKTKFSPQQITLLRRELEDTRNKKWI